MPLLLAGVALVSPLPLAAQGFAALVSPPRFELSGKPGETLRQAFEITHSGAAASRYRFYTADWKLSAGGAVDFHADAPLPGSCRPWVAIERRDLVLESRDKARFRFEVQIPPQAPPGLCRFALMIEGEEQRTAASAALSFPVSGRIGVIVYVSIGDAAPVLELESITVERGSDQVARQPVLQLRNSGNAHARLSGVLSAIDARGQALELVPASLPILPGERRGIGLSVSRPGSSVAVEPTYPLRVKGSLEWGQRQRLEIERTVDDGTRGPN